MSVEWPSPNHPFNSFIRAALDKISIDFSIGKLYLDDITDPGFYLIYDKIDYFAYDKCKDIFASIPASEFNNFMNHLIDKYSTILEENPDNSELINIIVNRIASKISFFNLVN